MPSTIRHTILEGFYGTEWSWKQRQQLIDLLALLPTQNFKLKLGGGASLPLFSQYCYAPKSDIYLRKSWRLSWPKPAFSSLRALSDYAKAKSIGFAVGFSPEGLFDEWLNDQAKAKLHLINKCDELRCLNLTMLGLFFDDMPASNPNVAKVQIEVCAFIQRLLPELSIQMCPSYYSYDDVLPELFGQIPDNYWSDIGEGLCNNVGLFWTGDKVISSSYSVESLSDITLSFRRPVTIWDNSCVNDGRLTSNFLPIKACSSLALIQKNNCIASFWLNPSNAFSVAIISLLTAVVQVADSEREAHDARLQKVLGLIDQRVGELINEYASDFLVTGLVSISQLKRAELVKRVEDVQRVIKKESVSKKVQDEAEVYWLNACLLEDIIRWLNGDFAFNPECLT